MANLCFGFLVRYWTGLSADCFAVSANFQGTTRVPSLLSANFQGTTRVPSLLKSSTVVPQKEQIEMYRAASKS